MALAAILVAVAIAVALPGASAQAFWALAPANMACTTFCAPYGGCAAAVAWPRSACAMADIANAACVTCADLAPGSPIAQDPEIIAGPTTFGDDGTCYWGGGVGTCDAVPDNVGDGNANARFCPCASQPALPAPCTVATYGAYGCTATPTTTGTATGSAPTPARTRTATRTPSSSSTDTPSSSATDTPSSSATQTPTSSSTQTPSSSSTRTPSSSQTRTPSSSATDTPSSSPTRTRPATATRSRPAICGHGGRCYDVSPQRTPANPPCGHGGRCFDPSPQRTPANPPCGHGGPCADVTHSKSPAATYVAPSRAQERS